LASPEVAVQLELKHIGYPCMNLYPPATATAIPATFLLKEAPGGLITRAV